jgi:hypothetical protein
MAGKGSGSTASRSAKTPATSKSSGAKAIRAGPKSSAKAATAKIGSAKSTAAKSSAAKPAAAKSGTAARETSKAKTAASAARKSSARQSSSSVSAIASDILSGKLKPTLEHIKALATSVLGQAQKKRQSKGKKE